MITHMRGTELLGKSFSTLPLTQTRCWYPLDRVLNMEIIYTEKCGPIIFYIHSSKSSRLIDLNEAQGSPPMLFHQKELKGTTLILAIPW